MESPPFCVKCRSLVIYRAAGQRQCINGHSQETTPGNPAELTYPRVARVGRRRPTRKRLNKSESLEYHYLKFYGTSRADVLTRRLCKYCLKEGAQRAVGRTLYHTDCLLKVNRAGVLRARSDAEERKNEHDST